MAFLGGLLGGGDGADPLDIYGDLFTDKQKSALRQKELSQGLFRMSEALAKAAQPSPYKPGIGSLGATLGSAASAFGGGGDETMNKQLQAMKLGEDLKASRANRAIQAKYKQILEARMKAAGMDPASPQGQQIIREQLAAPPGQTTTPPTATPPATPPLPGPAYTGPTNEELGAPPLAAPPTNEELGAPPPPGSPRPGGLPARVGMRGTGPNAVMIDLDTGQPIQSAPGGPITPRPNLGPNVVSRPGQLPYVQPYQPPPGGGGPLKQTGLLPPPDQVVGPDGQPLTGAGVLPNMLASLTGGAPGGRLPFQLAASTSTGGATPGAAGDDPVLDTIAKYESNGRNIHQQVTSPSVSTAQGPWMITNSTWRDIAPKVGIDVSQYPNAMSVPVPVQREVAARLKAERGLAPWAPYNKRLADAVGWQGQSARGERPADAVLPSGSGGGGFGPGGDMQALRALMQLTGGGEQPEDDPFTAPADMTGARSGGLDTVLPSPGGPTGLPVRQATAALAPYATGNARLGGPSSVAGVGASMSSKIEAMVQAMPPNVRERFLITSGFRDAQRQAQVNPGVTDSRHMHGAAVDLTKDPVVLNWINRNPQFGLGFPLQADPREINHLEMIDPNGQRLPPQDTVIPSGRGIPRSALANVADTAPGTGAAPGLPGTGSSVIPGINMTPEELALLNAYGTLGGVKSPFDSLLETYYKSPGYLGEAATATSTAQKKVDLEYGPQIKRAETLADLQAQIELKPKLERDIAWAKIDPSISEHERKAVVDRETKRLEQIQTAMTTSREVVVTPPGETARKLTLTNEQILRLNQGKGLPELGLPPMSAVQLGEPVLSPGETTQQQKAAELPYTSKNVTLTWPDGETRKLDVTGQQAKNIAEGKPVPEIGWPGTTGGGAAPGTAGTGARVGETVYPPGHEKATEIMLTQRRPKAEAAVQSLNFNDTAKQLLDGGIISGYGAGFRLDAAKAKALLGWDDARIANTEVFLATQARAVAAGLASGAFGSGSSITDNDRRYMATIAGADSNLDEKSLRFLLRQNETAANWEINRYQRDVEKHDPRGLLPILRVDVPPRAEAKPSANQPKIVGQGQRVGDRTYFKWSDGQWRPEGEIPGEEKR